MPNFGFDLILLFFRCHIDSFFCRNWFHFLGFATVKQAIMKPAGEINYMSHSVYVTNHLL